jgi:hypothetical protein
MQFANHVTRTSSDSSISIEVGYRLDDLGTEVRFSVRVRYFTLLHSVEAGSEVHLTSIQWVPKDISFGLKRLELYCHSTPVYIKG